jgi:antitoxin FitA
MGSITIRNINEEIKKGARLAAAANGRSVEAELRALLEKTYGPAIDERAAKIRAMSPKVFIEHLIKTANEADIGQYVPPRENENFEFPDL